MDSKKTAADIDSYIAGFPKEVQLILQTVRTTIQKAAPDATEAMAYGIPTFKWNGRNLVHFGGFKAHIGFYPAPQGLEAFKAELSKYKGAKGSVQFPLDQPMPLTLITKIVKYRVGEEEARVVAKSAKPGNPRKTK